MKNLTFVCAILFVLLTLADTDLGQSRSLLIDSTRPSVFISFDKAGLLPPLFEGESGDRYWLKLHNNTAVKLFVCKFDVPKRYGDYGIETEVVEEFGRSAGIAHPRGYLPTDVCGIQSIDPGSSVSFSVPQAQLGPGLMIRVQFYYAWTDNWRKDTKEGTWTYVLFGNSDLPSIERSKSSQRP